VIFHSYVNLPEGNRKRLLNQPDLGPYDFPFPTSFRLSRSGRPGFGAQEVGTAGGRLRSVRSSGRL
jgi:hypothetical protein